ncbi:MAG: NYN domain-containing protein [Candidatus Uhrbacteria bacterium]
MIQHPDQRVGIFIDTQNMYYSARNAFGRKVNFGNIVKEAVGERKLVRAVAYVVSTKTDEERTFFGALQNLGIETKEKELVQYESGQKKADWDVGLTMDIVRMLDMLDVVVLVSGDGDFEPLVDYVRNRGRIVEVMSFRETTSAKLVEAADNYINLSESPKKFLIGPQRHGPMRPPKGGEILVEKTEGVKGIEPFDSEASLKAFGGAEEKEGEQNTDDVEFWKW